MLKLFPKQFCLRGAFVSLAMSLSVGLQAQTAVVTSGAGVPGGLPSVGAGGALPIAAGGMSASLPQQQPVVAKFSGETPGVEVNPIHPPLRVSEPSQFQRFVKEATGRLLPMYGRDLFDSPQAYAADSSLPAPDNYLLGPGDEVRLQVVGPQEFGASLVVDRNGQVIIPKAGALTLAGVAVRDLESTFKAHLGKVFTNFQVNVTMGRLRGIQVYVVGQAQQPGTFYLSSLSTLVNALFVSGGPNANGSMRNIELKRAGKTIGKLDLYDFIARGDKSRDLPLMSGDVIVIPPVGSRVAIAGAFDQAAIYELKSAATNVGEILALGGGVPALATTQKALLERISKTSTPPRQVQDVMLDERGLRQVLQDGDVLTLLDISHAFANAVTLQGTVAVPLRYRWFEGMRILDLIPERDALITSGYYKRKNLLVQHADTTQIAGATVSSRMRGMVDQINWDYAVIERLDRNKLTTQLIPFDLGKAVLQKDPVHNLALETGDVITILSQGDLRVSQERQNRLIRIEGEVAAPGVYQALPGETLPQLVTRIGGLTSQAYVFGTEFNRESVRTRQQENLDILTRKLEAQLQAGPGIQVANLGAESAAQIQAQQQQQQVLVKGQLDRLKSLKSNGRIALELDPQGQTVAALPELPLEDGDRIQVPAMPGFVSAVGAVNNENVFIYKSGKTVADIFKSAGVREDAEPDHAFVLRADGSIIARNDRAGLFGGSFESLRLMPGDTVVVPAQIDRESRYAAVTRVLKDWTQILGNLGLGVAAINSISK
jgi:protein involved in polysaccharide export with SLBB domain